MRDRRGLADTTIAHSLPVAEALLGTVNDDPGRLDAAGVRKFVLEYIRRHAPASAGCVTTTVRCFLRWLVAQNRCATDLAEAVPTVPTWRLARLPRYLPADDVERIIAACDRSSLVARAIAPCCFCSLAWACARVTSSGSASATSSGSTDASASSARAGARRGCRFLKTSATRSWATSRSSVPPPPRTTSS